MESTFTYSEFTTRNIGFVSQEEQEMLRTLRVFIPGVGGMGGAAVECLARAGVENFIIAEIDHFEISNINRQIFASTDVVGKHKGEVAQQILQTINPNINVELRNENWIHELDDILKRVDIVINGCDDVKATILMLRKCKEYNLTAIDAFASPLPSVYVIKPNDKRPEEVFGFPTVGIPIDKITKEMEGGCMGKEVEHVAVNSNSLNYIDINIAAEIMNGKRKRISFAPMVWLTGCMMAYEVIRVRLNKKGGPDVRGVFYNPWTMKTEKPKGAIMGAVRRYFVRKFMKKI